MHFKIRVLKHKRGHKTGIVTFIVTYFIFFFFSFFGDYHLKNHPPSPSSQIYHYIFLVTFIITSGFKSKPLSYINACSKVQSWFSLLKVFFSSVYTPPWPDGKLYKLLSFENILAHHLCQPDHCLCSSPPYISTGL